MEHVILIRSDRLSDSSLVYAVVIGGIDFPAISESDAENLANRFRDAVKRHTNETVRIGYRRKVA